MPGWNDILTLLNTADTVLGIVVILLALDRFLTWRGRKRG